tara:strand:+ start:458 stop:694 length:237 start_codon:yes stop_codon:yes gene_type:complete
MIVEDMLFATMHENVGEKGRNGTSDGLSENGDDTSQEFSDKLSTIQMFIDDGIEGEVKVFERKRTRIEFVFEGHGGEL